MDVYHKVLLKLYQVTGGKDSQLVDLKDLVKNLGFLGNYNDISQMLSSQGWIAETSKVNFVRMTHWGVNEVRNSGTAIQDVTQVVKNSTMKIIADAKQFIISLEELSAEASQENFKEAENKLMEINAAIQKLKANIE